MATTFRRSGRHISPPRRATYRLWRVYGTLHELHGQTMEQVKEFAESLNYKVLVRQSETQEWTFRLATDFAGFVQDAMLVPSEKLEACRWCIAN